MANYEGRTVLIIGAARQGLALARYLANHGARVVLNDQRPAEKMQAALRALEGLPVAWSLGAHPLDLLDGVDLVCLSGGVPLDNPLVVETLRRGLPLSNDSQIFMEVVPCPVIGITGSAGKTTTTHLVGRMAETALRPPRRAWVGGNIGRPLIDLVDEMQPEDLAVVEFSSFQLEQMTISPRIGAILNITPNHLDRHGTMEAYTAAKARLIQFQSAGNVAVLNREDPGSWDLRKRTPGRLVSFGLACPEPGATGAYLNGEHLCLQDGSETIDIMPRSAIQLRGEHNLMNVLAACAVAHAANFPLAAMRAGVEGFTGVPHRLEWVRSLHGAEWYNDSIATAPERTMAAIRSFSEPLVLLLGGRDKNLPWVDLSRLVHQRVDHLVIFGEAAGKILAAIGETPQEERPYTIDRANNLREAIQAAAAVAGNGDVVLLSPGGTSFDEFKDFEERGERYRQWVNELQ